MWANFKYSRTILTNQNFNHGRVNSGNVSYHAIQNPLSSHHLSRNVKITTYRPIMLPVVLYGRETRSLTLREEHRVRVFQNRALRKMFVQTSDDVKES